MRTQPGPEYLARIAETFPLRDGRCTERAFEVIRQSTRRSAPAGETPTRRAPVEAREVPPGARA